MISLKAAPSPQSYIWAGIDPGINPMYESSYHGGVFDKKEDVENFLFNHHDQSCNVYQGNKVAFDLESVKVETEKVTGVKLKP